MLAFIITKHCILFSFDANLAPFSFPFMFNPSSCVFCRNEENKTKIEQFGQEMKKLRKLQSWLQPQQSMVATMTQKYD